MADFRRWFAATPAYAQVEVHHAIADSGLVAIHQLDHLSVEGWNVLEGAVD